MSAAGLRYRQVSPPRELAPFIECLWTVWDTELRRNRPLERIVPDACPEIILHLGDPFRRRVSGRWVRQPVAFLAGTLSKPWTLRAGTAVETFGIRFRPGAITALFDVDMKSAADRETRLELLIGQAGTRGFLRKLRVAGNRAGRFRILKEVLLERASPIRPRSIVTQRGVDRTLESRGQERIETLARSLGISRRRLERAFDRDLGIRPKLFARIVRLSAALATLAGAERENLVDVALEGGYFDQAHLSRDFRVVAGRRPRAGATADGEMSRHFTGRERLLSFLAGE
jgi:AraC-like DNA-binding protein